MSKLLCVAAILVITASVVSAQGEPKEPPRGSVPEISTQVGVGALTLLTGGMLVLRARKK